MPHHVKQVLNEIIWILCCLHVGKDTSINFALTIVQGLETRGCKLTKTLNERVGAWHKVIDSGVPLYDGEGVVRILWLAWDGSKVWVLRDKGLQPE